MPRDEKGKCGRLGHKLRWALSKHMHRAGRGEHKPSHIGGCLSFSVSYFLKAVFLKG